MTIPQKPSNSSQTHRRSGPEEPLSVWLGPSSKLPDDLGFFAFLEIIKRYVPELTYTLEKPNYARFRLGSQHPAEPNPKVKAMRGRLNGLIGHEDIESLFGKFDIDIQRFRDGYNAHYQLSPPDDSAQINAESNR